MNLDIHAIQNICKRYPDVKRLYTAIKNSTSETILICDSSAATAQVIENELKRQLNLRFKAVVTLSEIDHTFKKSYQIIEMLSHVGYSGVKIIYSNKTF